MALAIVLGADAPTVTPDFIGQRYINTTTGDRYTALGTSAAGDWDQDGAGGAQSNPAPVIDHGTVIVANIDLSAGVHHRADEGTAVIFDDLVHVAQVAGAVLAMSAAGDCMVDVGSGWTAATAVGEAVHGLFAVGATFYAVAATKLYLSVDAGASWTPKGTTNIGSGETLRAGLHDGSQFVLYTDDGDFFHFVYSSADGDTWTQQAADPLGSINTHEGHLAYDGVGRYLLTAGPGNLAYSDNLIAWTAPATNPAVGQLVDLIHVTGNVWAACGPTDGLLLTTDHGVNWAAPAAAGWAGRAAYALAVSGADLLVSADDDDALGYGIYTTADNGASMTIRQWTAELWIDQFASGATVYGVGASALAIESAAPANGFDLTHLVLLSANVFGAAPGGRYEAKVLATHPMLESPPFVWMVGAGSWATAINGFGATHNSATQIITDDGGASAMVTILGDDV